MSSATTASERIGVRALRDSLSAQLQRVKDGESIEVTEHGRVIARILPPEGESTIDRLIAEGLIELPTAPRVPLPEPIRGTGGASDLIADQRR